MAADSRGRTVDEALIYTTGFFGIAPVDAANVIPKVDLGSADLGDELSPIPAGFKYVGLRTSDGGPEQGREAGEAIEFLEDGFSINADGSITLTMTLAQFNATTRELVHGKAPDANGVIAVTDSTPNNRYIALAESVYKSGAVKREHGVVRVTEVSIGKDERGSVNGIPVTFQWVRSELFDNALYWEAFLPAETAPVDPEG